MISESHSDWKRCPERCSRRRQSWKLVELPVVDDGDVGEGVGPVGVGVGDVDVGLGRHPRVADRVGAGVAAEPVGGGDGVGVAEVLDDLQRVPEREHLGVADPLDRVHQRLQVPVEAEADRHRPRGPLDRGDLGTGGAQTGLDLAPLALDPLGEVGIVLARLAQLDVHDVGVGRAPVEGESGRVGPAVLHRLEHRGHVAADLMFAVAVAVDDPGDPAHGLAPAAHGSTVRYSSRSQSVTAAM